MRDYKKVKTQHCVHGVHNIVYWGKVKNSDFNNFESTAIHNAQWSSIYISFTKRTEPVVQIGEFLKCFYASLCPWGRQDFFGYTNRCVFF